MKTGIVGLVVILFWALTAEGVGLFITVMAAMAFLGKGIAANDTVLTVYIVVSILTAYLFPIFLAAAADVNIFKRFGLVIVGLVIMSMLFALPSSFVMDGGCKAGKERAVWAMISIPLPWGLLWATNADNARSSMVCDGGAGTP